jgi:hypothetical protein
MNLRQQHEVLVADFLARGGKITKLPPARPTVASDVLRYLQDRKVDVHPVTDEGGAETKYVYKGGVISLKTLVAIANRHRSRRRLPPFQLTATTLN